MTDASESGRSAQGSAATLDRSSLVERVKDVPGVARAVRVSKEGACVGGRTPDGEALAARITRLAAVGDGVGEVLGLGGVRSALLHGGARHMLLEAGKDEHLGLGIEGAEPGAVEAEVRKLLGPIP